MAYDAKPYARHRGYKGTVGCIEIMDDVFIGINVTIDGDVRIGPKAIVAAGAVVTKDVPPNFVVGGLPGEIINIRQSWHRNIRKCRPI